MIEIDGLTKRYGEKTAVDGLSFDVQPGEPRGPALTSPGRGNATALAALFIGELGS